MFEFDPLKSAMNADNHGIDFNHGQELWSDPDLIVLSSKYPDEKRFLAIGSITDINWTAIFTEHNENLRIIIVPGSCIFVEPLRRCQNL